MSLLLSVQRTGRHRTAWAQLQSARPVEGEPGLFQTFLTLPADLRQAIRRFHQVVAQLEAQDEWKLELVQLDGAYWIRLCQRSGRFRYALFPASARTPFRIPTGHGPVRRLTHPAPTGTWHLVTGRNAEKFLHEWLSHPAEEGLPVPEDVTLAHVPPAPAAGSDLRLVRGRVRPHRRVPLPARFLLLRTVSEGRFDPIRRRLSATVAESFVRTGDLLQSVCPFRFHVSVDELNRGYAGAVSDRCWPPVGFFCSKFGRPVFGRIDSPPLLFHNIPLSVEE